jgi:hypothetical protein
MKSAFIGSLWLFIWICDFAASSTVNFECPCEVFSIVALSIISAWNFGKAIF